MEATGVCRATGVYWKPVWHILDEDFFRPRKGSLGVDYPILFPGGSDVTQEGVAYPKWFQGGKELQVAGIEGLPEIIEKQSTKQTRQEPFGSIKRSCCPLISLV
jgi:hypothetical protein